MSENIDSDLIIVKLRPWQLALAFSILAFIAGLVLGFVLWAGDGETEIAVVPTQEPPTQIVSVPMATDIPPTATTTVQISLTATPSFITVDKDGITRYAIPEDDDPVLGPDDAPITIIEFSDFRCGYCARFHNETFGQIIENYGDVIRFIYRDFPLGNNSGSYSTAEAANCAGDQDNYWEFHDKLFIGGQQLMNADVYLQYAEELGLDIVEYQECVDSRKYQAEIAADYTAAREFGINSTPTFFINGIPIVGAQPYENFVEIIEAELARLED